MSNHDDDDDIFIACRYGDIDDIQHFVNNFGPASLSPLRDQNGNTILHMICGNGHVEALEYVLPLIAPDLLAVKNNAQSTPLHWAALNSELAIVQKLVEFPSGPGINLIDIKNSAGRSALAEAELAGWDEGAKWLVQMMRVDAAKSHSVEEDEDDAIDGVGEDNQVDEDLVANGDGR